MGTHPIFESDFDCLTEKIMAGAQDVNLKDYFKNFEDKLLVKMPKQEEADITSATRLLEERREMVEVEHALIAQKEEFQMRMESLQQRTEELDRKEQQLKESLLKFDKFLKENDAKRARAIKKATDEKELCKVKDKEIQKLEEQHQDASEQEKARLVRFTEEKNNQILHYNNQLAQLQTRLDKAQSNAVKWESKWTHIQNTAAKKTLLLGRIKIATHNLFQLVNKHLKQQAAAVPLENTALQLDKIQMFIQDLNQITQETKRKEAASQSQAVLNI